LPKLPGEALAVVSNFEADWRRIYFEEAAASGLSQTEAGFREWWRRLGVAVYADETRATARDLAACLSAGAYGPGIFFNVEG
jgi:hypothetical protein